MLRVVASDDDNNLGGKLDTESTCNCWPPAVFVLVPHGGRPFGECVQANNVLRRRMMMICRNYPSTDVAQEHCAVRSPLLRLALPTSSPLTCEVLCCIHHNNRLGYQDVVCSVGSNNHKNNRRSNCDHHIFHLYSQTWTIDAGVAASRFIKRSSQPPLARRLLVSIIHSTWRVANSLVTLACAQLQKFVVATLSDCAVYSTIAVHLIAGEKRRKLSQ
jgi:hypothetical protein